MFKKEYLIGFMVGIGTTASGYYLYKKNKTKVDSFLRSQGIKVPNRTDEDTSSMSVEDLIREKERLEDVIAEKEQASQEEPAE